MLATVVFLSFPTPTDSFPIQQAYRFLSMATFDTARKAMVSVASPVVAASDHDDGSGGRMITALFSLFTQFFCLVHFYYQSFSFLSHNSPYPSFTLMCDYSLCLSQILVIFPSVDDCFESSYNKCITPNQLKMTVSDRFILHGAPEPKLITKTLIF